MLTMLWNISVSLRGYLRYYMPTNRAVDWLRTPGGMKWALPVAVVATPAYLFAMSICASLVERGGPVYLNCLVPMFAWNSLKFAGTGLWALAYSSTLWLVRSESSLRSHGELDDTDMDVSGSAIRIVSGHSRVLRPYRPRLLVPREYRARR